MTSPIQSGCAQPQWSDCRDWLVGHGRCGSSHDSQENRRKNRKLHFVTSRSAACRRNRPAKECTGAPDRPDSRATSRQCGGRQRKKAAVELAVLATAAPSPKSWLQITRTTPQHLPHAPEALGSRYIRASSCRANMTGHIYPRSKKTSTKCPSHNEPLTIRAVVRNRPP